MTAANDLGQCSASVSWNPPSATDNVGVISFNSTYMPGDIFPVGSTNVSYTARDQAGNESTCSFTVLVLDEEPPQSSLCPEDQVVVHSDPEILPVLTLPIPQFMDNCEIDVIESTPTAEEEFPIGQSLVTYTAEDPSGNTSTCTYTVAISFELQLEPGWNLLSVPVIPDKNISQSLEET